MGATRLGSPEGMRGQKGSILPRYRAASLVLSVIAALACLAPLLSAPSPSLPSQGDPPSTPGGSPWTPSTHSSSYERRVSEEGFGSASTASRIVGPDYADQQVGEQAEEQAEEVLEGEGTSSATERTLQDFDGVVAGISHEEEGGRLRDGRNRCFVDEEGYHRCYPTVFFLGTSKCGTTSLARWLDAHPSTHWVANPRRPHQIEQTGVKEAHVFDDPPKGDRESEQDMLHEKLFITAPKVHADGVVIDYTPHYLAVAETPHRISDMYGGAESGLKFIVTLREPAGRAISSWEFKNEFNPKKGRQEESRSLSKTVQDGMRRSAKLDACVSTANKKTMTSRVRDLNVCNPRKFLEMPLFVSHVGKSMYKLQLERWFDLFGRDNFKVVFTDDMAVDPVGVLKDVLEFLELDLTDEDESKGLPDMKKWKKITGMAYNKTKSKKKEELSTQVTDDVLQDLHKYFAPHNRALEKLLDGPVPPAWNF